MRDLVPGPGTGLRPARGAGLRARPGRFVDRRTTGVRDQARAHPRGRLREPAAGRSGDRCTLASRSGWNATGEASNEHAPLLAHHYAEAVRPGRYSTWPGPAGKSRPSGCAARQSRWSRRAAELAVGRYEIDEGLTLLRSGAEPGERRPGAGRDLAAGSASGLRPQVRRRAFPGRPCSKRSTSPAPRRRCTPTSPCNRWSERGCGSSSQTGPSSTAGSSRPWSSAEDGSLAKGNALAALAMNDGDESAARSALAIAERLGDRRASLHSPWTALSDAALVSQGLRPGLRRDGSR